MTILTSFQKQTRAMEVAAYLEHDAWRKVCEQLRAIGAVTDEDLSAPQSKRDTAAGQLFGAIREWGRLEAIRTQEYNSSLTDSDRAILEQS